MWNQGVEVQSVKVIIANFTIDVMSEEESEEEDGEKYLVKRPLDWEGHRLTAIKKTFDKKHLDSLSQFQQNARLKCQIGLPIKSAIPRGVPKSWIKGN